MGEPEALIGGWLVTPHTCCPSGQDDSPGLKGCCQATNPIQRVSAFGSETASHGDDPKVRSQPIAAVRRAEAPTSKQPTDTRFPMTGMGRVNCQLKHPLFAFIHQRFPKPCDSHPRASRR
jgi:hypothetical protein